MKRILLVISLASMTGCSSLVQLSEKHSGERSVMRVEHREKVKEVKEKNEKEMDKLVKKQSIEFGLYTADKLKKLREFFK